jgi:hypothetical protein
LEQVGQNIRVFMALSSWRSFYQVYFAGKDVGLTSVFGQSCLFCDQLLLRHIHQSVSHSHDRCTKPIRHIPRPKVLKKVNSKKMYMRNKVPCLWAFCLGAFMGSPVVLHEHSSLTSYKSVVCDMICSTYQTLSESIFGLH